MIKKSTKLLCLMALFVSLSNLANGQTDFKNSVKISPLTFPKGKIAVIHYERSVYKNFTIALGVAPLLEPLLGSWLYPINKFNTGLAIDPEIRWYAKSDKVMDGFFFGIYNTTRFSSWESSNDYTDLFTSKPTVLLDVSLTRTIYGIQLGSQKLIGKNIAIDVYGGAGLSASNYKAYKMGTKDLYEQTSVGGINLRLNVSIGYQF
jgi:hypothetical protein